jgi:hypothetical protein
LEIKRSKFKSYLAFFVVSAAAVLLLIIFFAASQYFYVKSVFWLGYYSFLVFVPFAGFLAWGLIYFFRETTITTEEFIEKNLKIKFARKFLLWLLKYKKIAFVVSAFALGPIFTPPFIKTCVPNDKKKAYLWAIGLNVISTAIGIGGYLGGKDFLKHYLSIIKLSI